MPEDTLPGRPGLKQRNRPLQRASPTSKPYSPYESVRNRLELPLADGRYSPGFFPSRVFSNHVSKPQTRPSHEDSNTRLCPCPEGPATQARDQEDFQSPEGLLPPPRPGRTRLTPESAKSTLSADSNSDMKLARTTLRWPLLLPGPWITGQAQRSWSGVLKSAVSGVSFRRRRLLFWGFLPSRNLVTLARAPALAYGLAELLSSRLRSPASSSDLRTPLPEGHVVVVSV
jgi:hypothetical protein